MLPKFQMFSLVQRFVLTLTVASMFRIAKRTRSASWKLLKLQRVSFFRVKIIQPWSGIQYDDDYDSATKGCTNPHCVKTNTEYANGYFKEIFENSISFCPFEDQFLEIDF